MPPGISMLSQSKLINAEDYIYGMNSRFLNVAMTVNIVITLKTGGKYEPTLSTCHIIFIT